MAAVFWASFGMLLYIYAGYPLLVWLLAGFFGRQPRAADITPPVSLLIPAYNEEAHIEERLRNSLALDYPKEKLEIVVASDGSTDATNAIVRRFGDRGVRLIAMERNIGKSAMLNRAVPQLGGEIIVLSDASTELERDALRKIIRPFADSSVGCVCGLYRLKAQSGDLRGEGEGLYWKYETAIKRQESRLHSILGAHGAFYAIRKSAFRPLPSGAINDDYVIAMRVVEQGLRAVYEPSAVGWERQPSSMEGEFARRRRIAVGNCQQIVELRGLLNPLRRSLDSPDQLDLEARSGYRLRHRATGAHWVAFMFFSHKVLRTLAPLFLILMPVSTFWLAQPWFSVFLAAQAAFYLAAWAGWLAQRSGRNIPLLSAPLYFCFGNLAMLAGLWSFCTRSQGVRWSSR